jgi:hypothetical protein
MAVYASKEKQDIEKLSYIANQSEDFPTGST